MENSQAALPNSNGEVKPKDTSTQMESSHAAVTASGGKDAGENRLRLKPLKRVVYYHHDELSIFDHGPSHPRRPFRGKLAHALIIGFGIYSECLEPLRPRLVTMTDFGQYHSDNYISILRFVQEYMNPLIKERAWLTEKPTIANSQDIDTWDKIAEKLKRFNLGLGPDSINSAMPGLLDYCRMYTTGTMGCVERLMSGDADIAINWYGGMSHARTSSAYGGCYVNDVVLAILMLLRRYKNVLFISVDGEHCDAVEEAFYTSNQVLTVSFHSKPSTDVFPGTGDIADIGYSSGSGYTVNVPLDQGIDDKAFLSLFEPIVKKARSNYKPEVIIYQSGGSLLFGDRFKEFNLTTHAMGECARLIRDFGLPLLCLGGSGTNMVATAKSWAYQTAVLTGTDAEISKQQEFQMNNLNGEPKPNIRIPLETEYREYFGPFYGLHVDGSNIDNTMTYGNAGAIKRKVLAQLNKLSKPK